MFVFFLMIRRPPRSTLFPYTTALPIFMEVGDHTTNSTQPTNRSQSQDLDVIMESFDKWQNVIASLMKERSTLLEEIKIMTNAKDKLSAKNLELEQTVNSLHGTLHGHHQKLHMVCDLEEQNRNLKQAVDTKEQELATMKSAMMTRINEHADIMQNLDQYHKDVTETLRSQLQEEAGVTIQHLQGLLDQGKEEINNLQKKIDQLEKDKEAEIAKLTMEYENKLTQLKQKTSTAAIQQGGTANQEIYRNKLQHLKGEYDQEVGLLKKTIVELQQKLSSHQADRLALVPSKKCKN